MSLSAMAKNYIGPNKKSPKTVYRIFSVLYYVLPNKYLIGNVKNKFQKKIQKKKFMIETSKHLPTNDNTKKKSYRQ